MKRILFLAVLACSSPALAQTTISALPSATTPLAGSEIIPLVQGGTTKQTGASNISDLFGDGGTLTGGTIAGGTLSGTLAGSPTFSGSPVFSGGVKVTGGSGAPSGTAQGFANASATNGLILLGQGSSLDFLLQNKTPATVCSVATGTTNLNCVGLQVGGSAVLTGNQSISLSGDATGSGATSIAVTVVKVNGVTYDTSPSTNTVPVITGSNTATYKAIPNCTDTSGQHLNYTTATSAFSCGTSKTATGTLTAGTPLVLSPYSSGQGTTTTQAHGLGARPTLLNIEMECLSADLNYSVGDVIKIPSELAHTSAADGPVIQVLADATNVKLLVHASIIPMVLDKTTLGNNEIAVAKWKITITPYLLN